ncbi:hypothetical protein G6F66_015037 [Rhizopus arrhizus]|nr:hypothetical protein G6F66_015037 [Rhizopus arrhizus]
MEALQRHQPRRRGALGPVAAICMGVAAAGAGARRLREAIGAVMQDDQLFAGSIAENISFFQGAAEQERVEHAARLAAIHDDHIVRRAEAAAYSCQGALP